MPALHGISAYAISETEPINFIPPALIRLATARTANPLIILELSARANAVTTQTDILPDNPGTGLRPISALSISANTLPRQEREVTSFLFSTRPWTGSPEDTFRANQRANPRIITAGRISRSVPVESAVQRRGQRTIGDATLANPDGALDFLVTDYSLDGGTIKAWLAEPGDTSDEWALLYEATIASVEATRKELRIGITTIADQLERPLQIRRYTGSGGISGDSAVAGRLKPTAWGEIPVCDPVLISQADNVYQVHDGQIYAVEWVREGGLDYDYTADYPNYEELAGATLDVGEYATCLTRGLFRIGTTLAGLVYPIRASVKGDARGNGYVSATGDILYRLARDRAFLRADQVDVNSFRGLPRGRVGFYTNGQQDLKVSDVFDALLGGVVGTYGVGRSAVVSVSRMLPAAQQLDDISVRGEQLFDIRVEARPVTPRITQPYSYRQNFAPVGEDDVSSSAEEGVANLLKTAALESSVTQQTDAAIAPIAQPTLVTYFVEQEAAEQVAYDALMFAQSNLVPVRADLGRIGLIADIGGVVSISDARFANDFRGVIYEQEDNLGAAVTSRVVAIG